MHTGSKPLAGSASGSLARRQVPGKRQNTGQAVAQQQLTRLRRVQRLARLLDTAIGIPGTKFRFGMDSLAGLIPAVGDAAMAVAALYIVYEAHQMGVSKRTRWKMLLNVFTDLGLGSIPLVGDVFDVFYKANRRNVRLLEAELKRSGLQ